MKRLIASALLLSLAACMEPPVSSAPPELLSPPADGQGVAVLPPQGLPQAHAARLQKAIADALIAAGAPATVETAPRVGALVAAAGRVTPGAPGEDTLLITWAAQLPGADKPIYLTQTETIPAGAGAEGPAQERLNAIAGRAALALVEVLNPTGLPSTKAPGAPAAAAKPEAPSFAVRVGKVSGAPGDGDVSLARSMVFALRDLGAPTTDKPGPGVWRIDGAVTAAPPQGDKRKIKLRWALFDPNGVEQAAADQANDVPAEAIAKHWGPLAALVTQAAAEGLAPALSEAAKVTKAAVNAPNPAPAPSAAPAPNPVPASAPVPASGTAVEAGTDEASLGPNPGVIPVPKAPAAAKPAAPAAKPAPAKAAKPAAKTAKPAPRRA